MPISANLRAGSGQPSPLDKVRATRKSRPVAGHMLVEMRLNALIGEPADKSAGQRSHCRWHETCGPQNTSLSHGLPA